MTPAIEEQLNKAPELRQLLVTAGAEILKASEGRMFPADAVILSALNRSVQQQEAFCMLVRGAIYGASTAILRMQLDNIVRIFGVMSSGDPHDAGNSILNGVKLSKLKDRRGKKMHDAYLVSRIREKADWFERVYHYCSGYVHLSETHFASLLSKSELDGDFRTFYFRATDDEVEERAWLELIRAFEVATKGSATLAGEWLKRRSRYGSLIELSEKYPGSV